MPIVELEQAKKAKIEELEKDYHDANLEPKIHEALVLTGKGAGTVREFYLFQKYNNPIPALDTDRSLIICINTNKNMPYPTIAKEGDKVTVRITPVLAKAILDHMVLRYQQNFAKFTVFSTQVYSIVYDPKLTIEQNIAKVDAIKWSNQFDPKILEPVSKLLNS